MRDGDRRGILWWWWRRLPDHEGELPRAVLAWRWGAQGERRTAALLRPLTEEGWSIFHDRACPDSEANIDHLAVGPNGLFVIDSKLWRGGRIRPGDTYRQVILDDEARDISSVFHEVRRAWQAVRDVMVEADVGVRPVVVIHGATVEEGGLRSEHGDLIDAHDIGRYLQSQATGELDSDQIARITRIIQDRFEPAA